MEEEVLAYPKKLQKLKADRSHPRDYPQTPPDVETQTNMLDWFSCESRDRQTDGRTDATKCIISLLPRPASQSTIIKVDLTKT